jgi:hypothetical protein
VQPEQIFYRFRYPFVTHAHQTLLNTPHSIHKNRLRGGHAVTVENRLSEGTRPQRREVLSVKIKLVAWVGRTRDFLRVFFSHHNAGWI